MTTAITTIPDTVLRPKFLSKQSPEIGFAALNHEVKKDVLIDIVIPVYNEESSLPTCIAELTNYLDVNFPYKYRISIVDNGSIDNTWEIAQLISRFYPSVTAIHMDQKGRGRALKYAWSRSDADILAYMDVDLSTDLAALEPMVTPLVEGQAAIATGSRLKKHSKVSRSFKREFISRSYNYILRASLKFKTSDAQCGFKAIRADVAQKLLPQIVDNDWFFDTELLAKVGHQDLPIHEVAVTWKEDADSRVKIIKTAKDDLKGIHRLRKELSTRPKWEKYTIAGILAATAILYGIGATRNGYGNSFYAAAVQAGTHSWKAMFFGSLDSSSFITVDKPPVALWFMEISTRIFGFHAWSMMLPEVLAGVATVYLVYASVRRWFSNKSALLAAAVMALTPVAVLMFGFDNPDAVLTLLLTSSVYAVIRALDSDHHPVRWLALSAVLTGFAFNTKMLQGLIVLPTLALVYLIAAKPSIMQRVKHLLIAGIFLAISALWWPVIVSSIPAGDRPYVGSSTNDSIWNLIVGYNGFGRLLGEGSGQGGRGGMGSQPGGAGGGTLPSGTAPTATRTSTGIPKTSRSALPTGGPGVSQSTAAPTGTRGPSHAGGSGMGGGPGGSGFGGSTGVLRMFNSDFGPNIGWFIPLSLVSVALVLWRQLRKPRTDKKRTAFLLWGGYLVLHIIVFSMVSGVIHPYYPVVMAPAVAALVGMGVPELLKEYRRRSSAAIILPLTVALTSITACIMLGYQSTWLPWLRWLVLGSGLIAAVALLIHLVESLGKYLKTALIAAVIACTLAPTAYAFDTATVVHTGSIPSAGPTGTGMAGSNNESASAEKSLVQYLLAHRDGAKWIVAVNSANESAPIQISSGEPVMAVGGFNGSDDALSVTELTKLVKNGELRYYAIESGQQSGTGGNSNSTIVTWVKAHGTIVNYGGSDYTLYKLSA